MSGMVDFIQRFDWVWLDETRFLDRRVRDIRAIRGAFGQTYDRP